MQIYLTIRFLALTIVIVPICTGVFTAIIKTFDKLHDIASFGIHFRLSWGYTLFGFTWTYLGCVLIPYRWLYTETGLYRAAIVYDTSIKLDHFVYFVS